LFGFTSFQSIDFSKIRGLGEVSHAGPSYIGAESLVSALSAPEQFLIEAGVALELIRQIRSLARCDGRYFLSFAEHDREFATRLYGDLRAKNRSCWIWTEDARAGQTLRGEIDAAIRECDRVLLIVSERSLESPAVHRELERTLQMEDRARRRDILVPIRLDDAIFQWSDEAQSDVTAKVIADFRGWRDPEQYQRSLNRLLAHLSVA
jgi:hypothetical protein